MKVLSERVSGVPSIRELVSRGEGKSMDIGCPSRLKQILELVRRACVRLQITVNHIEIGCSGSQVEAVARTRTVWILPSQRIRPDYQCLLLRCEYRMISPTSREIYRKTSLPAVEFAIAISSTVF